MDLLNAFSFFVHSKASLTEASAPRNERLTIMMDAWTDGHGQRLLRAFKSSRILVMRHVCSGDRLLILNSIP